MRLSPGFGTASSSITHCVKNLTHCVILTDFRGENIPRQMSTPVDTSLTGTALHVIV
jgi:hypothetical protein